MKLYILGMLMISCCSGVATSYTASGTCCWRLYPARLFRGARVSVGRGEIGVAAAGIASAERINCPRDEDSSRI